MIILYDYFRSTASFRVRIALNIKQIAYKSIPINLIQDGGQQHSADYMQYNPQGLVPTLIDEENNNIVITQSLAILEYLEEQYPDPPLLPDDLVTKTRIRTISQLIACDIHPLNNLRVLQYLTNTLGHTEQIKTTWYHNWIDKGFCALEELLKKYQPEPSCCCIGNSPTLADILLIPQVYNANRFKCAIDKYSRICQINNHCLQLQEFAQAYPDN